MYYSRNYYCSSESKGIEMVDFIGGLLYILNTNLLMPGFIGMAITIGIGLAVTKKSNEIMIMLLPIAIILRYAIGINVADIFMYISGILFVIALGNTQMGELIKTRKIDKNEIFDKRAKKIMKDLARMETFKNVGTKTRKLIYEGKQITSIPYKTAAK